MNLSLFSCLIYTTLVMGNGQGEAVAGPSASPYPPSPYGYLWFYEPDGRGGIRKRVEPYQPREGDIVFFDSLDKLWTCFYRIAGTDAPLHVGMMVKNCQGRYHSLEAGPDNKIRVFLLEATQRLQEYSGVIQIRRCRKTLSEEESRALTAFAEAQVGKGLAVVRLVTQITPFKIRGGYKEKLFATTWMNRCRWLCIELVVTCGTMVGMFDPASIKGNAIYPKDLLQDTPRYNISSSHEPAGFWSPRP